MCNWKPKYPPDYECKEPPLPDDPDGYCILHAEDDKKDLEAFRQKVAERIATTGNTIDLQRCYFHVPFDIKDFEGLLGKPVNLAEATFTKGAYFRGAKFPGGADFRGATFSEGAYFIEAKFTEGAYFSGAKFTEGANFSGATFTKGADFIMTTLGTVTFFQDTRFLGDMRFQDVNLSNSSFLHSNIDKVDFRYCKFNKKPERFLFFLKFNKEPERLFFFLPHIRQNILWDELKADGEVEKNLSETGTGFFPFFIPGSYRVRMTKDDKKLREEKYEPVRKLYLELKRNFEDKKDWNTAGDFHYGEMECRRKMKGWFSLEFFYWSTSGHGERPWRAFSWLAILTLVFAWFYVVPVSKSPPGGQETLQTQTDSPQPLHSSAPASEGREGIDPQPVTLAPPIQGQEAQLANEPKGQSWSEWLYGFLDHHPSIKKYLTGFNTSLRVTFHLDRDQKEGWLATIQSIFGPAFVALFFLALRRKVKR